MGFNYDRTIRKIMVDNSLFILLVYSMLQCRIVDAQSAVLVIWPPKSASFAAVSVTHN